MSRVRGSLDIARPVEVVFDTVADQRNEPRYNPTMTASTKVTDGPIGGRHPVRSHGHESGQPPPGHDRVRQARSPAPHRLAQRDGRRHCARTHPVRPAPAGTRFSWDWKVTLGERRFAGPLVGLIGRRQERTIWTGLKDHLEGADIPG